MDAKDIALSVVSATRNLFSPKPVAKSGTLSTSNGKTILTTSSGQKYIDNYSTNKSNVAMNNSALLPNRYTPLMTPRKSDPSVTDTKQLSNSTSYGSGGEHGFQGKLSAPVKGAMQITKIVTTRQLK